MASKKTLLHIDGDAFFASVYQATHAEAWGKPVIIGRERGIATALSYEAKKYGITRGMMVSEAKKLCPHLHVVSSDYRTYQIFSNKLVNIAKSVTPYVERYSVDEVFLDITGFDTIHHMSYKQLALSLKERIEKSLGLTVSIGVAPTKTLTKIASEAEKPSGFVVLDDTNTSDYLRRTQIGNVWGIGYRLTKRMHMLGIQTAYDFVHESEDVLRSRFNKMVMQTWYELRGKPIYSLSNEKKTAYKSIRKSSTVTPPTTDPEILFARILHHIEKAFVKARTYAYRVRYIEIFLKTQRFTYHKATVKLKEPIAYPYLIRAAIRSAFKQAYRQNTPYRATGCTLSNFEDKSSRQQKLFNKDAVIEKKLARIYSLYEDRKIRFGTDLLEKRQYHRKPLFKVIGFDT